MNTDNPMGTAAQWIMDRFRDGYHEQHFGVGRAAFILMAQAALAAAAAILKQAGCERAEAHQHFDATWDAVTVKMREEAN